jgi:hypothetical protein
MLLQILARTTAHTHPTVCATQSTNQSWARTRSATSCWTLLASRPTGRWQRCWRRSSSSSSSRCVERGGQNRIGSKGVGCVHSRGVARDGRGAGDAAQAHRAAGVVDVGGAAGSDAWLTGHHAREAARLGPDPPTNAASQFTTPTAHRSAPRSTPSVRCLVASTPRSPPRWCTACWGSACTACLSTTACCASRWGRVDVCVCGWVGACVWVWGCG